MAFTDMLISAVTQELQHRRVELDSANDVRKVQIVINLARGTQDPRSIVFTAEREREFERPRANVRASLSIKRP